MTGTSSALWLPLLARRIEQPPVSPDDHKIVALKGTDALRRSDALIPRARFPNAATVGESRSDRSDADPQLTNFKFPSLYPFVLPVVLY